MVASQTFLILLKIGKTHGNGTVSESVRRARAWNKVRGDGFEHLMSSGVPLGGQKLSPMVELNGRPAASFERYVEAEACRL